MSGGTYDVTELDHAVGLALMLANRTEWAGPKGSEVHRYVFSDVRVEAMVRDECGQVDAAMAMAALRGGRVRLLRAPMNRESRCVGKALYRDAVA